MSNDHTQAPATEAGVILQAANNINALGQMFLFLKAVTTAQPVRISLHQNLHLTVSSELIKDAIMAEFERIGNDLAANNIDVSRVIDGLADQYEKALASMQAATQKGG